RSNLLTRLYAIYLTDVRKEMMLDGVLHELRVVLQSHLRQQPRAMRPHRSHAQIQLGGDLPRRFARRDQAQDLELAIGEALMQVLAALVDHAEGDALREVGGEEALAARHLADGSDEVRPRAIL